MSRAAAWEFGVWAAPLMLMAAAGPVAAQVAFEWATVGNPSNAPDPLNAGFLDWPPDLGSVGYIYRIAIHEVTNVQYAVFLNAVAATDTNGLYNPSMGTDPGGITRDGSPGGYTYSVRLNMGDKPVNFVSFFDAMRFVNWLQNGQPTGAESLNTTEAGAYLILDGLVEPRACGPTYALPLENEWYKAAYHQPAEASGDTDDYWLYATSSNVALPAEPPIASYHGTFAQSEGLEWIDALFVSGAGQASRVVRGLASTGRYYFGAASEAPSIGFRVATRNTGYADLDLDLDVDLRDFQHFQNQMGGPK